MEYADRVRLLVVGVTTRNEVYRLFGAPDEVYSTENRWAFMYPKEIEVWDYKTSSVKLERTVGLYVSFDAGGIVVDFFDTMAVLGVATVGPETSARVPDR